MNKQKVLMIWWHKQCRCFTIKIKKKTQSVVFRHLGETFLSFNRRLEKFPSWVSHHDTPARAPRVPTESFRPVPSVPAPDLSPRPGPEDPAGSQTWQSGERSSTPSSKLREQPPRVTPTFLCVRFRFRQRHQFSWQRAGRKPSATLGSFR